MTSPDPFSEEAAAGRFDDTLRHQLGGFETAPAPAAWETLRTQLPRPAPAASPWRSRLATFSGGVIVGALLWWGGEHVKTAATSRVESAEPALTRGAPLASRPTGGAEPAARPAPARAPGLAPAPPLTSQAARSVAVAGRAFAAPRPTTLPLRGPGPSARLTQEAAAPPVSPGPRTVSGAGLPPALPAPASQPAAGVEGRDQLIRQELHAYLAPVAQAADTARAARLRALVGKQTAALARLAARLDSVKQFLPEAPPALAAPSGERPTAPAAESWPTFPPARSPWSALLLAETTPSWSLLPSRNPTTPMQEQAVAVLSQQVLGQWQAAPRWALRVGLGGTTLTTQARTTAERTTERLIVDSTTTTRAGDYNDITTVTTVLIVRTDSIDRYEPILNGSGQIIGYDTIWVTRTDTVPSTITTTVYDTVRTTVVTRRTETLRERQQQQFRPVYRFWTLPVAVRYSLLATPRWTLGVVLGGQVQVLRDAQRPVWTGEQYELRRVGSREGPYRPVSLSVSAGLEAQYRLSPRLSALVAPVARWWALTPTRDASTARRLLPAAQVGLSYGF